MRHRVLLPALLLMALGTGVFLAGRPHELPRPTCAVGSGNEECTIGVACGRATADGRPLLWKTRDRSGYAHNEVHYNRKSGIPFVSVVDANGNSDSPSWMGLNEYGFAVVNSNCLDLTKREGIDSNGELMRLALSRCKGVQEFVELLEATDGQRDTHGCFAVIDSTGAAFIFEVTPNRFWTFDADQADDGYLVRTNFACCDTFAGIEGLAGAERFVRSSHLIDSFVAADDLTHRSILRIQMRDLSDDKSEPVPVPCYDCGDSNHPGQFDARWSICRSTSVSAAVIHGVAPGLDGSEPAFLTTMWVILGQPATAIAVPYWPVGPTPTVANGEPTAPLCDRALVICAELFHQPNRNLLNTFRLRDGAGGGFWPQLFPVEDEILDHTAFLMEQWRQDPPAWPALLATEDSLAQRALMAMNALVGVEPDEPVAMVPEFRLDPIQPNPFNAGATISYELSMPGRVAISVFDLRGNRLARLPAGTQAEGRHQVVWRPGEVASGTYLVRLEFDGKAITRTCVLVK